ncbi:MAG: hypothetical protein KatS3mg062_0825 [Tepidiforma sp.]|nr:MAG: hypothetical protein KatS3mg062_0825 [Tepidiforma sp.]
MQAVLLGLVLLLTVAALYVRPFGARDWQVAVGGALAAWALGPLGFREGLEAVAAFGESAGLFLRADAGRGGC